MSGAAVPFQALPHFTGDAWQGGSQLPDPKLGWVMLNAGGGHPGNDAAHAAIRRWVAPRAGRVSISGSLEHSAEPGDGVRGRVVVPGHGVLAEWSVHHGKSATTVPPFTVAAGDTSTWSSIAGTVPAMTVFAGTQPSGWNRRLATPGSGIQRPVSAGLPRSP